MIEAKLLKVTTIREVDLLGATPRETERYTVGLRLTGSGRSVQISAKVSSDDLAQLIEMIAPATSNMTAQAPADNQATQRTQRTFDVSPVPAEPEHTIFWSRDEEVLSVPGLVERLREVELPEPCSIDQFKEAMDILNSMLPANPPKHNGDLLAEQRWQNSGADPSADVEADDVPYL